MQMPVIAPGGKRLLLPLLPLPLLFHDVVVSLVPFVVVLPVAASD